MPIVCIKVCDSVVQGHHVSNNFWAATEGGILQCRREMSNPHNPFAVAILKDWVTIGHVIMT